MGHGSNYITAFREEHQLDVRFSGTVKVQLPAVSRGCPMSFRRGVFVLSVTNSGGLVNNSVRPKVSQECASAASAQFRSAAMYGASVYLILSLVTAPCNTLRHGLAFFGRRLQRTRTLFPSRFALRGSSTRDR